MIRCWWWVGVDCSRSSPLWLCSRYQPIVVVVMDYTTRHHHHSSSRRCSWEHLSISDHPKAGIRHNRRSSRSMRHRLCMAFRADTAVQRISYRRARFRGGTTQPTLHHTPHHHRTAPPHLTLSRGVLVIRCKNCTKMNTTGYNTYAHHTSSHIITSINRVTDLS